MRKLASTLVATAALAACTGDPAPAAPVAPVEEPPKVWESWSREQPSTAELPPLQGRRDVRGIIHLHSPFSHDACDGEGFVQGAIDRECLADLRAGLCATRQDYAVLTDHPAHMAEQEFEALFHLEDGDEAVRDAAGAIHGARWACPDGTSVLVVVGFEDELMPARLLRHAEGTAAEREAFYNEYTPEAVTALRALGGKVLIAHTEQRDVPTLLALDVDGVEVYNLHANLAPNIRSEWLDLPAFEPTALLLDLWANPDPGLEPDLAALGFLQLTRQAVVRWEALTLARRTIGTAGTDAHQNVFSDHLADGERGDSYRRMMRWFSNHLLVDELTPEGLDEAIGAARNYIAFEVLGTPIGFRFEAQAGGAAIGGIGDELPAAGTTLSVVVPRILEGLPRNALPPEVKVRLYRVTGTPEAPVEELVSESADSVSIVAPGPGVYHAEIFLTPHHLRPWLGLHADAFDRELPWIFSGAIYLR